MSVFVRQEKITVRIEFQSDPIDPTKMRLRPTIVQEVSQRPGDTLSSCLEVGNQLVCKAGFSKEVARDCVAH